MEERVYSFGMMLEALKEFNEVKGTNICTGISCFDCPLKKIKVTNNKDACDVLVKISIALENQEE